MFVKHQHQYLKQQLEAKGKELQAALSSPERQFGLLNLVRDFEYLYIQVSAYEDALNDLKNAFDEKPLT